MLSIIVPTLNAAGHLPKTLRALAGAHGALPFEVIVADGGSVDETALIAAREDVIFIESPRGRGVQLATGANEAAGDWLLFLHADTRLDEGWAQAVSAFIEDRDNRDRVGFFRFALDDKARAARCLELIVAGRARLLGLPYGDQGLLISRDFYERLGGYRRIPLMEDVDMVRRIGRRQLRPLAATAVTSAEKYRRDGYLMRPIRNFLVLILYGLGVSPRTIQSFYR